MAGLAGYLMRVQKSATNFKVENCRSDLHTDQVETTNSESTGKGEYIAGIADGDLDIDIVYQISDGPFAALAPGGTYSLTFFPDKGTTGSNITGNVLVGSFGFISNVRGKVTSRVTGKFTGGYTATNL